MSLDKVRKIELDNYLAEEQVDPLATMLNELIKKGEYK